MPGTYNPENSRVYKKSQITVLDKTNKIEKTFKMHSWTSIKVFRIILKQSFFI